MGMRTTSAMGTRRSGINLMKTITYEKHKYRVAFFDQYRVVIDIPEKLQLGRYSRLPIPVGWFTSRQQVMIRKACRRLKLI